MGDGQPGVDLARPESGEALWGDAHAAVGLRNSPFGLDPSLSQQALQRRVQRAFLDPQHLVREQMDPLGDRVAVEAPGVPGDIGKLPGD